jgi:hypothetical protein
MLELCKEEGKKAFYVLINSALVGKIILYLSTCTVKQQLRYSTVVKVSFVLCVLYKGFRCIESYLRGRKLAAVTYTSLHSLQLEYYAIYYTSLYRFRGPF